jgi:hypothetical protein
LAATKKPAGKPAWAADFEAYGGAPPPVIGFVDAGKLLADAQAKVPELAQCASTLQLGAGIGRLSFTMAGDTKQVNTRIALDIGPLAQRVEASMMPVPEGWAQVTAQVPIAAQMNIDLNAFRARFDSCLKLLDIDLRELDEFGVRAGRAFIRTFDPDERKGTGAIALDLSHKDFFAAKLDEIPMRSAFERNRAFGPYKGKSVAIPMFLTVDYVLTDQVALAGVGDGLLIQLVGRGMAQKGPLLEVALQPLGLSIEAWTELLGLIDVDNPKRVAQGLHKWREAKLTARIEGTRLVLQASGTRR